MILTCNSGESLDASRDLIFSMLCATSNIFTFFEEAGLRWELSGLSVYEGGLAASYWLLLHKDVNFKSECVLIKIKHDFTDNAFI